MTKTEYFAALSAHDWSYSSSDDHRTYLRGVESENALLSAAKADEDLMVMYRAFSAWAAIAFCGRGNVVKPELSDFVVSS